MTTSWWPTNKWWVATITAAGTVAVMLWTGDGISTDEEKVVLIGLIVQRLAAYWARNEPEIVQVPAEQMVVTPQKPAA